MIRGLYNWLFNDDVCNYFIVDGRQCILLGVDNDVLFVDNLYWSVYNNLISSNVNCVILIVNLSYDFFFFFNIIYCVGIDFYNEQFIFI